MITKMPKESTQELLEYYEHKLEFHNQLIIPQDFHLTAKHEQEVYIMKRTIVALRELIARLDKDVK